MRETAPRAQFSIITSDTYSTTLLRGFGGSSVRSLWRSSARSVWGKT